ncbi:hypothetical protein R3P38DRAFT_817917 [Favolaschia claudopus]|uniref:Yeast cell wall synthesis Kre9/Knh1-like N-terminal domain-containing protein n=1 Tax=Favolaschia claudopus TaxID=2862362 RepID=A0AAW0C1E9_9AGAR
MLSTVFAAVLASSAILLSNAEVAPNAPGPNDVFNEGTKCHISWAGDSAGTDAWKDMAIELMTGANEKMVHITTVATKQDGTKDGVFDYDCPEVTPNSKIYFYQFTSGGTPNVTWTTRFLLAGADGSSTPPTETEKGANGEDVGYGTGALKDPSTAVAAPTFNNDPSNSASGGSSNSAVLPGSSSSAPSNPASASNSQSSAPSRPSSPSGSGSGSSPSPSASNNAAAALGPMASNVHVLPFVAALTACAAAFTILL